MVEKLSAQQNVRLNNYLKAHPKAKKEDAIKLLFNFSQDNVQGSAIHENKPSVKQDIQLASGRKIVVKNGQARYYAADGTELNKKYFEQKEGRIELKPSGRYAVTKNGQTKYYAADGTELKASYFNQVEASDVRVKGKNGKTYNFNKTLEKRINNVAANIEKAENENGFIGKTWSGFKNLTGIGDSSDKVREQQANEKKLLAQFNSNTQNRAKIFEQLTGQKYTPENLEKFISGDIKLKSEISLAAYKEGQATAVDVGADIVSGVAAVGIYSAAVAAAPFTGGASIAVGVAAAGASGAAIKTGLKAADALTGGRSYSLNDAGHDAATGAFSGVLAPVTGGMGGAVGKSVATRFGIQAVKTAGKEAVSEAAKTGVKQGVKQTLKTALTNPAGYEYIGGNAAKRGVAMAAEMATDGALGGAADNAFRTSLDGGNLSEVAQSSLEGFIGGAIMSPIIGGGMKATGKAGHQIGTSLKGGKEVAADAVGASAAKSADAKPADIKPAAVSPENANGVHTASSGKKAYQKPKVEVARFELQDDIMTGETSASEGTKKTSFWSKLFGEKPSVVTELDSSINIHNISKSGVKNGGVFTHNNQLYIRNGNESVKLNISKKTFDRLFPEETLHFEQHGTNTCYLLSTIDAAFDTPQGKVNILKYFNEDSNGNIIFDKGKVKILFPKGKARTLSVGVTKNQGVAIIEQASAAISANKGEIGIHNINKFSDKELCNEMAAMKGPSFAAQFIKGKWDFNKGKIYLNTDKYDFGNTPQGYAKYKSDLLNRLRTMKFNSNEIYTVQYDMHQRAIKGFENINGVDYVVISDPYHAGVLQRMSFNEFVNKKPVFNTIHFESSSLTTANVPKSKIHTESKLVQSQVESPQAQVKSDNTIHPTHVQEPKQKVTSKFGTPQKTDIYAEPCHIGTVDGKKYTAAFKGRTPSGAFTISVNGKEYTIRDNETLKIADGLTIRKSGNDVFAVHRPKIDDTPSNTPTAKSHTEAVPTTAKQGSAIHQQQQVHTSEDTQIKTGNSEIDFKEQYKHIPTENFYKNMILSANTDWHNLQLQNSKISIRYIDNKIELGVTTPTGSGLKAYNLKPGSARTIGQTKDGSYLNIKRHNDGTYELVKEFIQYNGTELYKLSLNG